MRLDVCTFNILFVIICNIFLCVPYWHQRQNRKSILTLQRTQVTQFTRWKATDETGQHVQILQYLFKEKVFPSMLGRFTAVQRGCMAWFYLSFTERTTTNAYIFSHNTTMVIQINPPKIPQPIQKKYLPSPLPIHFCWNSPYPLCRHWSQPIMMTNKLLKKFSERLMFNLFGSGHQTIQKL